MAQHKAPNDQVEEEVPSANTAKSWGGLCLTLGIYGRWMVFAVKLQVQEGRHGNQNVDGQHTEHTGYLMRWKALARPWPWHAIRREWVQTDAQAVGGECEGEKAARALIPTEAGKGKAGDEWSHENGLESEAPESKMAIKTAFDACRGTAKGRRATRRRAYSPCLPCQWARCSGRRSQIQGRRHCCQQRFP